MGTDVMDSLHPICLQPAARATLLHALQPLLASVPVLSLLLLAGEATEVDDGSCRLAAVLDEVEQLVLSGVRRTDVVLRCGEHCCAVILPGAGAEGATRVAHRFRRRLADLQVEILPLQVGLASAPEQATTSEALIDLASWPCLRLVPGAGVEGVRYDEAEERVRSDGVLPVRERRSSLIPEEAAAQAGEHCTRSRKADGSETQRRSLHDQTRIRPPVTFVQARARALGIPYLAPPQQIPSSVRNLLPLEVMRQLQCLPIGRERNALTVALADPTDQAVLRRLEQLTGMTIFPVMTDPDVLETLTQPPRSRRASQVSSASAGHSRN